MATKFARAALLVLAYLSITCSANVYDLELDGGAKPDATGLDAELANGAAFNATLKKMVDGDTLVIPNKTFHLMGGIQADSLNSVTIVLDGTLVFSNNVKKWPRIGDGDKADVTECLHFWNMTNFTFTSNNGPFGGKLDGQGSAWWGIPGVGYLLRGENRPRMLSVSGSRDVLVENLAFVQPPYWCVWMNSMANLEIRWSSIDARRLDKTHDSHGGVELTAFNTDGFDVTGDGIWIHDSWVWNQDDTFCIKDGTSNVLVERVNASGVGLTIGSIASNIKNITFRDIRMHHTNKGIYMKFRGAGNIEDVLYENIVIDEPESWPIWIGPAQQSDSNYPCAAHPCSLCWPTYGDCTPPANATYRNITLRNVTVNSPKTTPGVILASATSPMENIVFDNVVINNPSTKKHDWGTGYKCEGVKSGVAIGGTDPVPSCFEDRTTKALAGGARKDEHADAEAGLGGIIQRLGGGVIGPELLYLEKRLGAGK